MSSYDPAGSIALVTGANRGIGRAFVEVLLARGASKVYAGARSAEAFDDLRSLDPERVTSAAKEYPGYLARPAGMYARGWMAVEKT